MEIWDTLIDGIIVIRVWSRCKTLRDKYMTFLMRPGSRLTTLVSQEMRDRIVHRYVLSVKEEKGDVSYPASEFMYILFMFYFVHVFLLLPQTETYFASVRKSRYG